MQPLLRLGVSQPHINISTAPQPVCTESLKCSNTLTETSMIPNNSCNHSCSTHTNKQAYNSDAIVTVPNIITEVWFCLCSCIPFCHPCYFNYVPNPTYRGPGNYKCSTAVYKAICRKKSSSGSMHCACLCFSVEQRENAAASSFAHWCCSLSDNVQGQWLHADPMRCSGIFISMWDCALWLIVDFQIHDRCLGHDEFSWLLISVTMQYCVHIENKNRSIINWLVHFLKGIRRSQVYKCILG